MKYLTIREFSELSGVTKQAIYQRIKRADPEFMKLVKKTETGMMISDEAVSYFDTVNKQGTLNNESQPPVDKQTINIDCTNCATIKRLESENEYLRTQSQSLIDLQSKQFTAMQEQINRLQSQIEEKDKLIAQQAQQMMEQTRLPAIVQPSIWQRIRWKFSRK